MKKNEELLNKRYRLVTSDIDGTLLNSQSKLSKATIDAVKNAVNRGVIFTLASGRSPYSQTPMRDELELAGMPVIAYNGVVVTVPETLGVPGPQKEIYSQYLRPEDALEIMRMGAALDTTMIIWSDRLYVSQVNSKTDAYSIVSDVRPVHSTDFEYMSSLGVKKIIWYDETANLDAFQRQIPDEWNRTVNHFTSSPFFLEFVDINVSKGIGLMKLAEYYNIPQSETIAFGDDCNDISMIEYAGLGVAMENAKSEVKAAADYITVSNNDDGVAYVLNKIK